MKPKDWGFTTALVIEPDVELHAIKVRPDESCSVHKHAHKVNAFYVTSGALDVLVYGVRPDGKPTDAPAFIMHLFKGDYYAVQPGVWHKFKTPVDSGCEGLELYYRNQVQPDDIQRFIPNGRGGVIQS